MVYRNLLYSLPVEDAISHSERGQNSSPQKYPELSDSSPASILHKNISLPPSFPHHGGVAESLLPNIIRILHTENAIGIPASQSII
ncbi:hypothetical protein CEXT_209411 [Caerostris extrusa]|uniref:Uncharacterized protein n=1 Tax=Caerostris extrusa TaxID=172846 RepID=A0AAV4PKZ8_CAEEX|nr:hypothetical protein CEXT_209411 [Caerostris extrusa]